MVDEAWSIVIVESVKFVVGHGAFTRLRSEGMDMLKGRECATCTILTLNTEMHCHASTNSEGLHIHTPCY